MNKSIRLFSLSKSCKKVCCSEITRNLASIKPVSTRTETTKQNNQMRLVDYLDPNKTKQQTVETKIDHVTKKEIKFYDPPYLAREAPFPNYELLNINLKGYDYATLDCIFRHVEKICSSLKLNVIETYAMPARTYKIKTYQPFSTNLDKEFELNTYHRVIRVKDLKSTFAPLLFESIQLNLPEGVQLSISVPTKEEDEFRFVPDIELKEMRQQLEELQGPPKYVPAASSGAASAPAAGAKPVAVPNKK